MKLFFPRRAQSVAGFILPGFLSILPHLAIAQPQDVPPPTAQATNSDFIEFTTPDFKLKLATASQTIAALQPKGAGDFDFTARRPAQKSVPATVIFNWAI